MDRRFLRSRADLEAGHLLEQLSQRQFVAPHRRVGDVLAEVQKTLHIDPEAATGAVQKLQLDPNRSIGRLGRTELTQLARSLYRHWQQSQIEPSAANA